ncbi:MAG: SDR family NAD(P)-dependent oxidoreductase [Planctomycetota bacterium]|nr:SDR family NAD(P)-dependent oxidoreductase [Planctomycetota bacterium]
MAEVAGRVALIAGGSGGIGSAVARALAQRGMRVFIGWHAHETAAQALATGLSGEAVRLDVTDTGLCDAVCRRIFERTGRLDVLVNCAAVNREAPALGMEDDAWREVLAGNLDGAFRLCRAAAKYMLLGRWGRIVNLSSSAAVRGGRGQINYAASKAGVEALTRVLALELGRKGVLVNCVAPGVIETGMSARIRGEHGAALREEIAVRRFGSPEEVAHVVAFLVSDECGYITGQTLRVDGGLAL